MSRFLRVSFVCVWTVCFVLGCGPTTEPTESNNQETQSETVGTTEPTSDGSTQQEIAPEKPGKDDVVTEPDSEPGAEPSPEKEAPVVPEDGGVAPEGAADSPDDTIVPEGPECSVAKSCPAGKVCRSGKCEDCQKDSECPEGQVCKQGVCESCAEDSDCATDQICSTGSCSKAECDSNTPCTNGQVCKQKRCDACTQDTECSSGQICESGTCQTPQCDSQTPCNDGKVCTQGRCSSCTNDKECGLNRICKASSCVTGCRDNNACTSKSASKCKVSTNTCVACLNTSHCGGGTICQKNKCVACKSDAQCPSTPKAPQLCLSGACKAADCRQDSDCSNGQVCKNHLCSKCSQDSDCATGEICASSVCRVGCRTKADCSGTQVCDSSSLTCKGCTANSDCQSGQLCKSSKCSGCNNDSECGSGKLCLNKLCIVGNCRTSTGGKVCKNNKLVSCKPGECGTGKVCDLGTCKTGDCVTTADCTGKICKNNVCSACTQDSDCAKGSLCLSGTCKAGACRSVSDCTQNVSCKIVTKTIQANPPLKAKSCELTVPNCVKSNNTCNTTTTGHGGAVCNKELSDHRCLANRTLCQMAKDAVHLARTAFSDTKDRNKFLDKKFKQVQTWSKGSEFAYLVTSTVSGLEVCHYSIRGMKDLPIKELKKMNKLVDCKTPASTSMNLAARDLGRCNKVGYDRYLLLRSVGMVSNVMQRTNRGQCAGGVRINGHSMGGVIAPIFAAELYKINPKRFSKAFLKTFTFGALRVFRTSDANFYHSRLDVQRWVYEGTDKFSDHVPSYPASSGGFRHFGQAYRAKKTCKNLKCSKSFNKESNQDWAPTSISVTDHAHTLYESMITKCNGL